jgi:hypothetical protein
MENDMLKPLVVLAALLVASDAGAARVLNVEFKFTPFTGDPGTADMVTTVPGHAAVWMNNIPIAEQEIGREEVPVLFDEREVAASVWVPTESLGGMVRQGTNVIRVEFEPENGKQKYRAQLRWASVMDETVSSDGDGTHASTNQAGEGVDDRSVTGKVVFEREFTADFAADQPWHHYPAVTALTDADKAALSAAVNARVDAFQPDFDGIYAIIGRNENADVAALKKEKCLDAAYAAGIRIVAAPAAELEFLTTGHAEVVVRATEGPLFVPEDPAAFETITDPEMQMCIGAALFGVYPPRLVFVKSPAGAWEVAY